MMKAFMGIFEKAGTVNINGDVYNGRSITVSNGEVIVDGKVQGAVGHQVTVNIIGNVELVSTASGNISVVGDVHSADTVSGDIDCNDVLGNIETVSGDVNCNDVSGRIRTVSGNIRQR